MRKFLRITYDGDLLQVKKFCLYIFFSNFSFFKNFQGGATAPPCGRPWLQHRSCNHIYLSPSMNIIKSNDYIRDLGITMSGDCSFNEHINMRQA